MRRAVVVAIMMFPTLGWASPDAAVDAGGWQYLINRLVADGVDQRHVLRAFNDPRMVAFTGLEFSADSPREPRARYRQFLQPATVSRARKCRVEYGPQLIAAERRTGVSANVIAAILFVETGCGRNTGKSIVLHRLARLAMANEPNNLQRNLARYTTDSGRLDPVVESQLRARARYLEATFYPEVRATFTVADRIGVGPLDLRGSPSGAFGYPQFLPTSFLEYGADGNGDGVISLYNADDAITSAARYLAGKGWRPGLTRKQQHQVIWHYNHSDAYVETVLTLAARVDPNAPAPTITKQVKAKPKAKAKTKQTAKAKGKPKQTASNKKK